jgi:ABC-type multidrug transport system ATPase subunit
MEAGVQYRQQVFYCGPAPIAFDHLSPIEFFGFMRTLYPSLDEEGLAKHIEGFGLHSFLEFPLASLSTGTQRKVWLSFALAAGTKVTLLDEPFNALDAKYLRSAFGHCAQDTSRAWIVASHEDLGVGLLMAETLQMALQGSK